MDLIESLLIQSAAEDSDAIRELSDLRARIAQLEAEAAEITLAERYRWLRLNDPNKVMRDE